MQVVGKLSQADLGSATAPAERVVQLLEDDKACLKLDELNKLLQILWERKLLLEQQDAETNLQLLLHFLRHSRFVTLCLCSPTLTVQQHSAACLVVASTVTDVFVRNLQPCATVCLQEGEVQAVDQLAVRAAVARL